MFQMGTFNVYICILVRYYFVLFFVWYITFECLYKHTSVGSGGHVVDRRTGSRGDSGSIPPIAVSFTPHLPVSFRRDTKSRWSLLSGVYARGSERSNSGGKCVTCSGLINSREEQLLR